MNFFLRNEPIGLWLVLVLILWITLPLDAFPSQRRRQQLLPAIDGSFTRPATAGLQSERGWQLPSKKQQQPFRLTQLKLAFANQSSENKEVHHRFAFDSKPNEESFFANGETNSGKVIQISSQIELPFSAEVAYEAYSDLPRQPSWSSWLESVVVLNNNNNNTIDGDATPKVESKWTSKIMGIRYSWTAQAVRNDRPHTIQWRSVTGLRNEGIVHFYPLKGNGYHQGPTLMTLQMAFCTPKAVTALVKRSKRISKFVEEGMIAQSLQDFRDVVLKETVEREDNSKLSSSSIL